MTDDYRSSHLSQEKGIRYHDAFLNDPYRRMVWQMEQGTLDNILSTFLRGAEIYHLDFACGTGRILSYLKCRAQNTVGVDLSPVMLDVARKNNREVEIIEGDLTRNDVLGQRRFNLITAFRFFPNAEDSLRQEAMKILARHLDDNGYLVFNNHKNTGSTRNRLARLFGHADFAGMSIAEVKSLLENNGLEIVKMYHLCTFPASDRYMLLPVSVLKFIEKFLSNIPVLRKFGENLVFVCRHAAHR
jgi:SAM-dependent methyltransferase